MNFEFALLIQSTLILVCAGLATAAMRRCSASTRHAVWAMALLCLLALPAVIIFFPQSLRIELPVLPEAMVRHEASSPGIPPTATAQQAALPAPPASVGVPSTNSTPVHWTWRSWILLGWLSGFIIILLKTLLAMVAARSMAKRSAAAASQEWASLTARLRHELSVTREVNLRIGGDMSPMTWGWRRPIILLPSLANQWTAERRLAVLAHELAHVKRRDGMTQILVQVTCSAYWFNPAVWFAERRMRIERERACDDYVLNLGTGAASYADHLLEIASGAQLGAFLATVSMAQPTQLEARLRAILNPHLKRSSLSRSTAGLLSSCLAVLVMGVASIQVTTLLSLTLPLVAAPRVPAPQTLESAIVSGRSLNANGTMNGISLALLNPTQGQQPPVGAPAADALYDLPDNEQDLLAYLEALAKRGIAAAVQGGAPAGTPASQALATANRTVALVVVLDHSGSMVGAKMDLAKEGAKTALSLLRDKDLFGVLTFDYNVQWALPITEALNKDAMREAINRIYATGNTNIYPALREAYQRLQATAADTKHMILLSDGQTPAQNFQELASEMLANKITVSTVALTAASDRVLMSNIAMWSKGRAYYVDSGENLPQIFQKEVELVLGNPVP